MVEQMYLRDANDFALLQSVVKIQLHIPEEYPIWLVFRHGSSFYGQEHRQQPYDCFRDITEAVINGSYKFIDYSLLANFVHGQGTSWDLPLDGFAVIVCEDAGVLDIFLEYGIITQNQRDHRAPYRASKWVVEQHSTKYDAYKYTINGELFGAQLWYGSYSWKQLKLHTFLHNRITDNKKLQQLHDKLNILAEVYKEEYFNIENSLINGYGDTPVASCMQGHGEYFKNFEDAGVLLKYNNNNVDGRAIIWSDQFIKGLPEGCQGFMDRIYPSGNHKVVKAFKSYAKAHNLLYKAEQNYDVKDSFVFNDQNMTLSLTLRPPNAGSSERYPYMDTFTYTNDFRVFRNDSGHIELTDTSGGTSQSETCCNCDCSVDEDDAYHDSNGDVWCPDCFHDNHSECSSCSEYHLRDDLHESDDGDICEACISRYNYRYCEDIEMYSTDWVCVNSGDYYNSTDGLYYAKDTEEWYESSDSLTMAYDTEEWYYSTGSLYFAVDVEEYYADEDSLVLTVDTNRYFAETDDLFEYNDGWYENAI